MDKKLLVTIFIWFLIIIIYNESMIIISYATADVNVIVLKPIKFKFFEANNNPIDINITFYYPNTNAEYDSVNVIGNKTIKVNRDLYDIKILAYDDFSILFRNVNLTNINSIDTGIDQLNAGIGDIVTYAINKTFPMKNATLTISYKNLTYNNELLLRVFACHNWDFSQRKCIDDFVIIDATQDVIEKKFIFTVTNLSAFSIKEIVSISEEPSIEEPSGGGPQPTKPQPALPELPEIIPSYLPTINIFLEYPTIKIVVSLLLFEIILFIVIYTIAVIIHKKFSRKKRL